MGSPDLVESQATLAAVASSAQMISLKKKRLMKSYGRDAALRRPYPDERHAKDWITDRRRRNSPQHQSTHRFTQQRIFLFTRNTERLLRTRHHRSIDPSR